MSKQSGKEWRRLCKMAIANLFLRTKQVSRWTPRFTMSEIDEVLEFVVNKVRKLFHMNPTFYAVLVGGANGDQDLLELIDGRSYELQCRTVSRTRETETCMCEGLLTQRSRSDSAARHLHLPPPTRIA
jgi:hypothetical protein